MQIDQAWDIIDRVLHDHAPLVAQTLRPPASQADLDRLAATVGHTLPSDLVTSLKIHDGQDNPSFLQDLFDHHTLLSAAAMVTHSDMRADALGDDIDDVSQWMVPDKVRTIMNCRGWLQFTTSESFGWAVDLDPLPAGEVGQVIWLPVDGPTPEPEFPSYRDWLSQLAQALDAGAFRVDETIGLWLET